MEYLKRFYVVLLCLSFAVRISEAYDPFDPNGNISIRWDTISWTPDGYVELKPQIKDDVPSSKETFHIAVAKVLTSSTCFLVFLTTNNILIVAKQGYWHLRVIKTNWLLSRLSRPGYTCSSVKIESPSVLYLSDGRGKSYAMMSWTVVCTYSQLLASKNPTCCVSLSSFYNLRITPCQSCTCGCQKKENCIMNDSRLSTVLKSNTEAELQCIEHMCPIRVHWHIKANYKEYWRIKISITNSVNNMNYTQWTLVVRHPNLNNVAKVYSFGYKPISQFKPLKAGQDGYVHTEIMFRKDMEIFTLENGWTFPLKVYFNGDECIMRDPDLYPYLPSSANARRVTLIVFALVLLFAF
ncbi:hypothetical protein ACFE04_020645 [Oxalis oulophora]